MCLGLLCYLAARAEVVLHTEVLLLIDDMRHGLYTHVVFAAGLCVCDF